MTWVKLQDLDPKSAAVLDTAIADELFRVLGELLDANLAGPKDLLHEQHPERSSGMDVQDLRAREGAALDTALGGQLFSAMEALADLDVQVTVKDGRYVITLHILAGERVIAAREFVVERDGLSDRHDLVLGQLAAAMLRQRESRRGKTAALSR